MNEMWIKKRREELGWTIEKLSERCGYVKSTLNAIECSNRRFKGSRWRTIHEIIDSMGCCIPGIPKTINNDWLFSELKKQGVSKECFCEEISITPTFYRQLERGIAHLETMKTETVLKILDFLDYGDDPVASKSFNPEPAKHKGFDEEKNDRECEDRLKSLAKNGVNYTKQARIPYTSCVPKNATVESYRAYAIKLAVECRYDDSVIKKLQAAKTRPEMEHILQAALFA